MAGRFPESIPLRADASTRRSRDGTTLLGGSPLRLVRLTAAGAAAADALLDGFRGPRTPTEAAVARRLVDAGLAHPVPDPGAAPAPAVTVVVPVRDDVAGLRVLLTHVATTDAAARRPDPVTIAAVVVVDDGSAEPGAVAAAVDEVRTRAGRREGAGAGPVGPVRIDVVRHERSRGPAAARNRGWLASTTDVVVLLDADVTPTPGWLARCLAHLQDPDVAVVAPRVTSPAADASVLARYEADRSPLDLGPEPARVVPRGRVAYVPSAALVCRRDALVALGGFDEALRTGEDVDLVWRAVASGMTVRYAPDAVVHHRPRATWMAAARQRRGYGEAAAALDRRHPGQVAPVECNVWSLAAWTVVGLGGRVGAVLGPLVAAGATAALVPMLEGRVDDPGREAARLAGRGTLSAGTWLARAVWRAWLPMALVLAVPSQRMRALLVVSAVVPGMVDHRASSRSLDPIRFVAIHAADDVAYGVGVWRGAWRSRSLRCLLPRISGLDGRVGITGLDRRRAPATRRAMGHALREIFSRRSDRG